MKMACGVNDSDNENIDSFAKSSDADSKQHNESRQCIRARMRAPLRANDAQARGKLWNARASVARNSDERKDELGLQKWCNTAHSPNSESNIMLPGVWHVEGWCENKVGLEDTRDVCPTIWCFQISHLILGISQECTWSFDPSMKNKTTVVSPSHHRGSLSATSLFAF
jgi:hypothetical protein